MRTATVILTQPQMQMTKAEAMAIQAKQVAHYQSWCPAVDLAALVAAATKSEELEEGVAYPMSKINQCVPRGAAIEWLIEKASKAA